MSETAGRVADSTGNWVDSFAPQISRPYLRLARLDRPIGSWLLLMPCWWSLGLAGMAAEAAPSLRNIVLFFIGAFAMRGAGCTWNDIVDRDLDAKVERTRSRPIPSGQVSVQAAAKRKVAPAEACKMFIALVAAQDKLLKFTTANSTACGIPQELVGQIKQAHVQTDQVRTRVCEAAARGPAQSGPSLSEALGTSRLADPSNIKRGGGTFDTLTGTPLGGTR